MTLALCYFCLHLIHQEFFWTSPQWNVALFEAYQFGVNYVSASINAVVAESMLKHLLDCKTVKGLTNEQVMAIEVEIAWQQERAEAWKALARALDPQESFENRRMALYCLRCHLAALGAGIVPYWQNKLMAWPVGGER